MSVFLDSSLTSYEFTGVCAIFEVANPFFNSFLIKHIIEVRFLKSSATNVRHLYTGVSMNNREALMPLNFVPR